MDSFEMDFYFFFYPFKKKKKKKVSKNLKITKRIDCITLLDK